MLTFMQTIQPLLKQVDLARYNSLRHILSRKYDHIAHHPGETPGLAENIHQQPKVFEAALVQHQLTYQG